VESKIAPGLCQSGNGRGAFRIIFEFGLVDNIDKTGKGGCHAQIVYHQYWMVENLKVTHYRDGDAIPNDDPGYPSLKKLGLPGALDNV